MSQTDKIDIEYVAKLARIELTQDEKILYSQQLSQILDHFERLSEIDVSDVEPSAHAYAVYNVFREDVPTQGLNLDDSLMNAPLMRDNQIVVPKVVDDA